MAIDRTVIHSFHFGVGFLKSLLDGIDTDKLTHQPAPGMNHPIWIVGHLAVTMGFGASQIGADYKAPEGWDALFNMGSKPVDDPAKYPDLATLLAELDKGVAAVAPYMGSVSDEVLSAEEPDEGFRKMMPTVGDGMTFILNGHFWMHIGQLSTWRRAIGLPPLF